MAIKDSARGIPEGEYEFMVHGGGDIKAAGAGAFQPGSFQVNDGGPCHGQFANTNIWFESASFSEDGRLTAGRLRKAAAQLALAVGADPDLDDYKFDIRDYGGKTFLARLTYDKNDFQQFKPGSCKSTAGGSSDRGVSERAAASGEDIPY